MTTSPARLPVWCAALSLAEALGIALVATAYAAADRGLAPPAVAILGAGAAEGLFLGTAQALTLRRLGAPPGLWILLTVTGAVAGYGLSLLAMGGDAGAGAAPPVWLILAGGAALGAGMGGLLGMVQSLGLGPYLAPRRWILCNVLGWMPAMALIMGAASLAGPDWPLALVAALGAVAGAGAGLSVALATWGPLRDWRG